MMARNSLLKLISVLFILLFAVKAEATACSQVPLNITDLTNIVENTGICPTPIEDDLWSYSIWGAEKKGAGDCDEFGMAYTDNFETANQSAQSSMSHEGGTVGSISAGESFTLSYDGGSLNVYYADINLDVSCGSPCLHYISEDGSTYNDSALTILDYGAGGCVLDSCTAPASGDWIIENNDNCLLNTTDKIIGNLNISAGSLQIGQSGDLNITGGYIYIYSGSNLTILSGGQLYG